jgi:hypothetical protein
MAEMVLTPLGRKAHWQPEYIAYTVELQQQYDDGLISLAEVELRLQERFPLEPLPDERTRRRWAHEKYADLPERRLGDNILVKGRLKKVISLSLKPFGGFQNREYSVFIRRPLSDSSV